MVQILEFRMRETKFLFHDHIDRVTIEFAKCKKDVAEAKFTEPGQCKYCGQKWFFGHRCLQYKVVNLLTAEEETLQEESPDEQQPS